MPAMDLALLRRLTTGEGWGLLQSLPPYDESARAGPAAAAARRRASTPTSSPPPSTRPGCGPGRSDKFGEFARGMVLTSDGLEQATRLAVAAQHAQRFRAAGIHTVHDLGCGIGSDAMAMAGLDLRVRAIDADEVTAGIAAVNLRHWPDSTAYQGRGRGVHRPLGRGRPRRGRLARPGATHTRGRRRHRPHPPDLQPRRDLAQLGPPSRRSPARCRPPAPS